MVIVLPKRDPCIGTSQARGAAYADHEEGEDEQPACPAFKFIRPLLLQLPQLLMLEPLQ